jgi:hypothetical protein
MELSAGDHDIEAVAEQLRAGFAAGPAEAQSTLRALYADLLEYRHRPPLPSDGIVERARLDSGAKKEAGAIGALIPDLRHDAVDVVIDGDHIDVRVRLGGTLPNGDTVHLRSEMAATVVEGRIVAIEHHMDDGIMDEWIQVAAAAGLATPAPPGGPDRDLI